MKQVILAVLVGVISCTVSSTGDFATKMLDATFKLFHTDSTRFTPVVLEWTRL